jgi:hypothetical protein
MLIRLLDALFTRYEIGRAGSVYLVRWTILGRRYGPGSKLFLHWFHRSDADHFHDHPWPFWSLILWGGYWEHSDAGRHWYRPGRLLRRSATWRHRVVLPEGRRAWTLVWTGPREREWGFHCPGGWRHWTEHQRQLEAAGDGCQ